MTKELLKVFLYLSLRSFFNRLFSLQEELFPSSMEWYSQTLQACRMGGDCVLESPTALTLIPSITEKVLIPYLLGQ